ncbi:MAG: sigma 54-interacting transcriptional regulator [Deltaproteobacteria bacterium]|jgi:transcriptional regulator with PAS, ATPase and Fis domain|nr:sigma 54-interacting transcriptional regulator [Deltaproteobacteria bacterium]
MPAKIGLIPPNAQIGERARDIAKSLGLADSLIIKEGAGEISRAHALELERQEVDVIITRGILVTMIQDIVKTPVVEIPVSGQDLATALHGAKKLTKIDHPRIGLLAFSSDQKDVQIFADLLDIDLKVYALYTDPLTPDLEVIRKQLDRAMSDGADVIVAGYISGKLAQQQGFATLMLDSGEVSLRIALMEAKKVAYARRLEKARSRRLQSVIDLSQNGILVVDHQGLLQSVNATARHLLNLQAGLEGLKAADVLPPTLVTRYLSSKDRIKDELATFFDNSLLISTENVKIDHRSEEKLITLEPVSSIRELETKIRKSLHARGLTCQYSFSDIWGESESLKTTIMTAKSFATTDSPILLLGETGTGKELFAQAIHQYSSVAHGPFVAINCAALPPSLLESELFGHEEGAFTGAKRSGKPGLFEMAHHGTIFLDEVSEMNHYGQTRLLRVLQEKCTMRVGGDKYIPVTARIIAASNRNLTVLVEKGDFRQDLYYRLKVLPLSIPPLRKRFGDITLLAKKFATVFKKKYGSQLYLTPKILAVLEKHHWPGNIRELSGVMERLLLMARSTKIDEINTKLAITSEYYLDDAHAESDQKINIPAVTSDHENIYQALAINNGVISKAASYLNIHRSTLLRKMKKLGIKLCKIVK